MWESGHWHRPWERCPADLNGDGTCYFNPQPHETHKAVKIYGLVTDGCPLSRVDSEMRSALEAGRLHAVDSRTLDIEHSSADVVLMALTASGIFQQQQMAASISRAMLGVGRAASNGDPTDRS